MLSRRCLASSASTSKILVGALPALEDLAKQADQARPRLVSATKSQVTPCPPLAGLQGIEHRWQLSGLLRSKSHTSVLGMEKASLTVSVPHVAYKYEMSPAEVALMCEAAGPRYEPNSKELTLTRRFMRGDPDVQVMGLQFVEVLGDQLRALVAASMAGVRPSLRLAQRLVEARRGEALLAWLRGEPTLPKPETLPSLEALGAFLARSSPPIVFSPTPQTQFRHRQAIEAAVELAKTVPAVEWLPDAFASAMRRDEPVLLSDLEQQPLLDRRRRQVDQARTRLLQDLAKGATTTAPPPLPPKAKPKAAPAPAPPSGKKKR